MTVVVEHLLVDGQKLDVRLFCGQQQNERVASVADPCCAAAAVHEVTAAKGQAKREHVTPTLKSVAAETLLQLDLVMP